MHYFRIPSEYWKDRIYSAKSAGLTTIQTYTIWNLHEPTPGVYDFTGNLDLIKFIKLVDSFNMTMIVRVGPFIDAEVSFGGLPPWLFSIPSMKVRTTNTDYITAVAKWLDMILRMIEPYLYKNGGHIIMVQLENEYGSYSCDREYLELMYKLYHERLGDNVVYFTTDNPLTVKCGSLPTRDVLTTIDFGVNDDPKFPQYNFNFLRDFQPKGPLVNSEFYTGWLDYWGTGHSTRPSKPLVLQFERLIKMGASVNFYMWHGGTTWGLMNGAEMSYFKPNPTSYDYDAPVSESGDIYQEKYWGIRNVTEKYFLPSKLPAPKPKPKLGPLTINMTQRESLLNQISAKTFITKSKYPKTFEELKVYDGVVAYQYLMDGNMTNIEDIAVMGTHDRAYVLSDTGSYQEIRRESSSSLTITKPDKHLTIFVENQGYLAFGPYMHDLLYQYKGIHNVTSADRTLENWSHYQLNLTHPLTDLPGESGKLPGVFAGKVDLSETELYDTFVDTTGWGKGFLVVNNKLIGRYWPQAGPQYTLYVPGVWLKPGQNDFIMIEFWQVCGTIVLRNSPILDGPVHNVE